MLMPCVGCSTPPAKRRDQGLAAIPATTPPRSLVLTSNRAPADWYPLFPNPVVAESLLDRLTNTSHKVFMNGPSYRPNKRPGRVVPTGKEDIR